jgi:aminoglycoside 6-adenylyltransferase
MDNLTSESDILSHLVRWGESQPLVRAMLLTSTRAIPGGVSDIFSDYDVVLALSDVRPFAKDRTWLEAFGTVLVMYQDPLESDEGRLHSGNVVQFESGLKIDFTLVETQYFASMKAQNIPLLQMQNVPSLQNVFQLPAELDAGYRILLDKDGLTAGLPPPTYQAYIPHPPTEAQYLERIECGLLDATYVAKYLRRDDRVAAQHILDNFLKRENLIPLLEWHFESDHGWKVKPGLHGRRIQRYLRPDLWADLERTYAGLGLEESWEALFRSLALLRKVAMEVGERLGFTFPGDMVGRAVGYIQKVKDLDLGAV